MSTTVTVAQNVCGDQPGLIQPNLDCSLCLIGFPQAGGTIGVTFYGPICPPSTTPSLSYWMGLSTKYAPFKCAWECPTATEPNANQWIAEATFGGASTGSCANQYKLRAVLTAANAYQVSVAITVYVLVHDGTGWTWTSYLSWSETLTEIINSDTTRYRGRAFASPGYISVSPALVGGKGDPVSYVKTVVGLQSMRLGCGSKAYSLPLCGFWDGNRWLTCLRGAIVSTADTSTRQFFQMGFDIGGCGAVGASYCGCDQFTLTATSPPAGSASQNADPQFITDYGVLGIPGGIEKVGAVQQIQVGGGSGIQVVAKMIIPPAAPAALPIGSAPLGDTGYTPAGVTGPLWVCTNDNGAGWVCSQPTVSKADSPHILTVNRTGFDVHLYAMRFPNDNILAAECGNGGAYPSPGESNPWWCVPSGCIQSPLQPPDATSGPHASYAACSAECGGVSALPPGIPEPEPQAPAPMPDSTQRLEFIRRTQRISLQPCRHLGDPAEETPSCGCSGGVVHHCGQMGKCVKSGASIPKNTLLKHWDDEIQSCWHCPHYQPAE